MLPLLEFGNFHKQFNSLFFYFENFQTHRTVSILYEHTGTFYLDLSTGNILPFLYVFIVVEPIEISCKHDMTYLILQHYLLRIRMQFIYHTQENEV